MSWMKNYIAEHLKWLLFFVIMILLMLGMLILNGVPTEEVVYAIGLCVAVFAVILILDGIGYHRKMKSIEQLAECNGDVEAYLDYPKSMLEEGYQSILKECNEDKINLQNEMNQRMRQMQEYYAMWVHQIKTPIAAMRLLLQGKVEEGINTAEEQDELFRVEQYVEMALNYARLDSESTDLLLKKIDLDGVIKDAVHKYARLFIRKKVKLQYEPVNCVVLSDEKWLGFVMEQLLSNAVKYAVGGTVQIYMKDEETLVIEDDGIGIRAEDLPRVVEKGYTGYNGRMEKKATGIGLYLCKRVTDKLSHGFTITSEEGVGTKVFIKFSKNTGEKFFE